MINPGAKDQVFSSKLTHPLANDPEAVITGSILIQENESQRMSQFEQSLQQQVFRSNIKILCYNDTLIGSKLPPGPWVVLYYSVLMGVKKRRIHNQMINNF